MLGHFAHPEDARGFRVGKLILFKDVHTDQASPVWVLPKSISVTFPGSLLRNGQVTACSSPRFPAELGSSFQPGSLVSCLQSPLGVPSE